jgi:hypothetical protein
MNANKTSKLAFMLMATDKMTATLQTASKKATRTLDGFSKMATQAGKGNMASGISITAAKVMINGKPVVYDDLLDGFTDVELTQIVEFANNIEGDAAKNV